MSGTFARWQPRYAEHGVATFPAEILPNRKKPKVSRADRIGLRYSAQLALKFPEADAFAFYAGPRSGITVVDLDTSDESMVGDVFAKYGPTSFVVRTPSRNGFHLYYRHGGEPRRVGHGASLDMLGSGIVIAPPSQAPAGRYQIIGGTLEDLDHLPTLLLQDNKPKPSEPARPNMRTVHEGERNDALFRFALRQVKFVDSFDALVDVVRTRNLELDVPLEDEEVMRVCQKPWQYEQEDRNLLGRGGAIVTEHSVVDQLKTDPHALALLDILKRHHWGREFVIANSMADSLEWPRRQFKSARSRLIEMGLVEEVRPKGRRTPAAYKLRLTVLGQ